MSELSKDETVKDEILKAAENVFQKWGFNKTTMEDIAHEAGKGKSTIYYYYKSKEEIFEVLAAKELNAIFERTKAAIEKIDSSKEKLKKYVTISINELKKTASIHPIVKGEMKGHKELIDKIRRQLDMREESTVLEILKRGFKLGEFRSLRESELGKAASVVVGIVRGLELYLFLEIDDDEKLDIATRLMAEGL
jgi:AcrR family transcriptional regulator